MKAIVNRSLNERLEPSVNAMVTNTYEENNELEVVALVAGDEYDGDDQWFQLKNGNYVWKGAVDPVDTDEGLSEENKIQYLISFRRVLGNGKPDMVSKGFPNVLYQTPVRIGTDESGIRVNELVPNLFATSVVQSVMNLPSRQKHVFVYIHGFQFAQGALGMKLLNQFTRNYMTYPDNKIAKVIMMTWPAQSWGRKHIDGRAKAAGKHFTEHNLFNVFKSLSEALAKEGRFLNLVVHSFGHQFLNGMLNPPPSQAVGKIFENVFLMASDITYLSTQEGGEELPDYFPKGSKSHRYNYEHLNHLAKNINVFYDEHDFLLYVSTRKFVKDPGAIEQTGPYRNLGNYGKVIPTSKPYLPDLNFTKVGDLPAGRAPVAWINFPFREIRTNHRRAIERVRKFSDYCGTGDLRVIFNSGRFKDRHRYLFTHKSVVDRVQDLLT